MENHLEIVLRLMLSHQEQYHPIHSSELTQISDEEDPSHCISVLRKARKVLPKIMKEVSSSDPNEKVMSTLCTLLSYFSGTEVCPYAPSVFSSNAGVILFFMVKVLSTPEYNGLHSRIIHVCEKMTALILENDFNLYVHLFHDLVALLCDVYYVEASDDWNSHEQVTLHCFLVSGTHLGKDTTYLKNGLNLCCQHDSTDLKHDEVVFELGKKTVPTLVFNSMSTLKMFRASMWHLLSPIILRAQHFLFQHPKMFELCRLIQATLDRSMLDDAISDVIHTILSHSPLPQFCACSISTSYLEASINLTHPIAHGTRILQAIVDNVLGHNDNVTVGVWKCFHEYGMKNSTDEDSIYLFCCGIKKVIQMGKLDAALPLLLHLVACCINDNRKIQQYIIEAVQSAIDVDAFWTEAMTHIRQYHTEYVPMEHKRQRIDNIPSQVDYKAYSAIIQKQTDSSSQSKLSQLILAMVYDTKYACVGLAIVLSLRNQENPSPEEIAVFRMVCHRLRIMTESNNSLILVVFLLRYLTDQELDQVPFLNRLEQLKPLDDFEQEVDFKQHGVKFLQSQTVDIQWIYSVSPSNQYLFLLCWIWMRSKALKLPSEWSQSLSARTILDLISQKDQRAIRFAPFFASTIIQSSHIPLQDVWSPIFNKLIALENDSTLIQVIVGTFGEFCCCMSYLDENQCKTNDSIQRKEHLFQCTCVSPTRKNLPHSQILINMLKKHLNSVQDGTLIQQILLTMTALLKHLPYLEIPQSFALQYVAALNHSNSSCREIIEINIGTLLPLLHAMVTDRQDQENQLVNQLFLLFNDILKQPDKIQSGCRAMTCMGSNCNLEDRFEREFFFMVLYRLITFWKYGSIELRQLGVREIKRMLSNQNLTWKQFSSQYPERIHITLIEQLLVDQQLSEFLDSFYGTHVHLSVYAKEYASCILPHLIVTKNQELLHAFAQLHGNGMTIETLVGDHVLSIVKEMLMQRVTSFDTIKEWEFLFQYLKDVGIRDVIQHKPLIVIYALVWELAGERQKAAKKAFRQVCKQFLDDEQHEVYHDRFHISQHFFLAIMTHLGQKLQSKTKCTRIRAIECTQVLLSMFETRGDLDNFVPKIMATLKLASQETSQEFLVAACIAWKTFVQLLSPESIKTNILAIVASLLRCIDPIEILFQQYTSGVVELDLQKESQQTALDILRSICAEPSVLGDPSVYFLLDLLPPVTESQRRYQNLPIHEDLQQILTLLQHWDGAVREVGLLHLIHILSSRSREVQDLITSMDEGIVHPCILATLKELLHLSRLETNESIQVLVARGLGALGAIDMARITPQALRPDTTSELSTKNLACHLIQTVLVKELRAAPLNTDVIALSIQQLLQFLAKLNSSTPDSSASATPSSSFVPSTSTMPEWMQRQFHSKGVDKIIVPYWSTKYQAPKFKPTTMPASSTFYEAHGSIAYDQWLVSWCRFLVDHSTFPERTIFIACRRSLTISLELARFLLPYLVQNVLKKPDTYVLIKREVLSVLQEDNMDTIHDAVSSHHHQCAQTVFSMLDELNDWVWANQRKKIALSQQPQVARHIDEVFDQEKESVEEFLKEIPLSVLSAAAFKIKAYARAIQYFESHLRQQSDSRVKLTSQDIKKLQQMYGSLEEPDMLLGLAIHRRWLHPQPTGSFQELLHLIAEHEHLARWEDALACYEQAIHHIHGSDVEVEIRSILYSGLIQCMIQLGRLEGALQHVRGIVNQYPDVIPAVYPCALECAWRLSRWDLLTELTTDAMKIKMDNEHGMKMKFAKTILCFHQDKKNIMIQLNQARLSIMGPLAAASQESYQRVYPLLHQLHFLHEIEQGYLVSQAPKPSDAWDKIYPWNRRNSMIAPALKFQEPILALRRVMLEELQLDRDILSSNWLQYAKMARKEGLLRTAESAVMHAQALGNRNAIIEQAKLYVERGNMYEALHVLEPIPIDISNLPKKSKDDKFSAKTLLLATNYMQLSSQKQGQYVIDRYKSVIDYDKEYAKGYFCMAKYYEVLLENDRREGEDGKADPYIYLPYVLENYVQSLKGSEKYLFQSLPRLLTLWYEFGELLQSTPKRNYRLEIDQDENRLMLQITKTIMDALHGLPESMWLACFPQVTSRICHPNPNVVEGVKAIMVRVLNKYPQRAMWYVLGLAQSLNTQRKARALEILKITQKQLSTSSNQNDMASVLSEGMRLVEELIKLAEHDPGNQKKIQIRLTRVRAKVLLPLQNNISRRISTGNDVYIKSFGEKADVMLTKEKPKRIQMQGTDGKMYSFLCKREKHGDLRKDARMMEFNGLMNKLLQREPDGRKRKLRLRTYAVICLNEESGLMEWVPNTRAMRHLISQIYKTERGFLQPVRLTTDIKDSFVNMQKQYANDIPKMTAIYQSKILTQPAFTPRFHQWFLNNFSDPTAWYEARDVFVRSAAVWSMVGHVVGLGDRHGENILIDCTTGECVHVDFDCLFDKGLKLARPEIVPFRLTPNMIDAFGLCGVEGVYRHTSEVTLGLLRDNRETLGSILESFVHDPLVEWSRNKSKQAIHSNTLKTTTTEQMNSEAKTMLKTIDDRLKGIWNLGKKQQRETIPLSVKGQVDRLISEAVSNENLAQMYIGWMPFL